jgi:type IV pilus assembly protein PilO
MMDDSKKVKKKFQIENTPANNLLMMLGGALVILIFVSFIDMSIVNTKTMSAKGYTTTLKNNYQKLLAENIDLQAAKDSAAVLQKQFDQLIATIPKNTKIDDVLERMSKLGTDLGLKIISFKPQEPTKTTFAKHTPINILVIGDFNHIAQFLSGVANLPYLLTIKDFEISRENPTATNLSMRITVDVVQYSPPTEGEKK